MIVKIMSQKLRLGTILFTLATICMIGMQGIISNVNADGGGGTFAFTSKPADLNEFTKDGTPDLLVWGVYSSMPNCYYELVIDGTAQGKVSIPRQDSTFSMDADPLTIGTYTIICNLWFFIAGEWYFQDFDSLTVIMIAPDNSKPTIELTPSAESSDINAFDNILTTIYWHIYDNIELQSFTVQPQKLNPLTLEWDNIILSETIRNPESNWDVLHELGSYRIYATAIDTNANDNSAYSGIVLIKDDDTSAPTVKVNYLTSITEGQDLVIDVIAEDNRNISSIIITFQGNAYDITTLKTLTLSTSTFEEDSYSFMVSVTDNDDDWTGDKSTFNNNGNAYNFIINAVPSTNLLDMIDALIEEVSEDKCIKNQQAMLNKLGELRSDAVNGLYTDAYDKLLHDIKPKLTALKMDELGNTFGDGIFKNPWACASKFAIYEELCNAILTALHAEL